MKNAWSTRKRKNSRQTALSNYLILLDYQKCRQNLIWADRTIPAGCVRKNQGNTFSEIPVSPRRKPAPSAFTRLPKRRQRKDDEAKPALQAPLKSLISARPETPAFPCFLRYQSFAARFPSARYFSADISPPRSPSPLAFDVHLWQQDRLKNRISPEIVRVVLLARADHGGQFGPAADVAGGTRSASASTPVAALAERGRGRRQAYRLCGLSARSSGGHCSHHRSRHANCGRSVANSRK